MKKLAFSLLFYRNLQVYLGIFDFFFLMNFYKNSKHCVGFTINANNNNSQYTHLSNPGWLPRYKFVVVLGTREYNENKR